MTQPPQQPDIWSDPTRLPAEQQQPQAPQPAAPHPPQGQTPEQPQTQQLYADPYGAAPTSAPGYAVPPGTQPSYPGYPGYGYPMPVSPPNNTLALVSMILSLVGLGCGICAPVGAIMGHIARRQIRERGEGGDGMALAGIIVGWIVTALYLIYVGFLVVIVIIGISSSSSTTY